MKESIVDIWKQELAAPAAEADAEPVEMTFDGLPCKVRPVPLEFYVRSGRMPSYLTRIVLASGDPAVIEREFATIKPEAVVEGREFQRAAVCRALVEPGVVDVTPGDEPEGTFSYRELAERRPAFVDAVFFWILRGCPVPAKGGEEEGLTADDLAEFPDGPRRGKRARARRDGARKRKAASRVVADQGPGAEA
jgi:hypothetical protein